MKDIVSVYIINIAVIIHIAAAIAEQPPCRVVGSRGGICYRDQGRLHAAQRVLHSVLDIVGVIELITLGF